MIEDDEFPAPKGRMIQHDAGAQREEIVGYLAEVCLGTASGDATLRVTCR